MSKVTEMAEAEAALAEAEPDDEPEPDEPEPDEPEPDDEPAPDEAEAVASFERALKAFEKENTRHEQAIGKLMGDDWEAFELCAGCAGVGFRPIEAMPYDPELERCATCKGHGSKLTGSVAPGKEVLECVDCQGQGFRVIVQPPAQAEPWQPPTPQFDQFTGQPLQGGASPENGLQRGPWAPGYVPSGRPAAVAAPAR